MPKPDEAKPGAVRGKKRLLGDWAILHAFGVFSVLILKFQRAKPFLVTTAQKLPDTAFRAFGGYGCHPFCRSATNRLTTRNRRLHSFGLWIKLGSATIGRENYAEKVSGSSFSFQNFLGALPDKQKPLSDYSIVNFSTLFFQN